MNIAIVIPVYREPLPEEIISLRRCCEVLNRYTMFIVAPEELSLTSYEDIWQSYGLSYKVERFAYSYFENIAGYNRLLLSEEFYIRFQEYDYILIYQPDAYVFADRLTEWCKKGYDYVGAPLIGNFAEKEYYPEMPMRVGNGGLSLRRVQAYLDYFASEKNVFTSKQIVERISLWKKPYTRIFVWLLMMLGWRNRPTSLAKHWKYNEDDFWSGVLDDTRYAMSKPLPEEALLFAFERFPKEMYAITNQLPFGCHAWLKYQYEDFWKDHIG